MTYQATIKHNSIASARVIKLSDDLAEAKQALVFCDTKDDPGFFLNVVMISAETGEPTQWCSRDPVMKFDEAIAEVGQMATSTIGQFMNRLTKMEQVL